MLDISEVAKIVEKLYFEENTTKEVISKLSNMFEDYTFYEWRNQIYATKDDSSCYPFSIFKVGLK
jgi:hypothetical protein